MSASLPTPPETVRESKHWTSQAACRGLSDPDIMFPNEGDRGEAARAVCRGCDVKAECLDFALRNHEEHGFWGGLSARERRLLSRGGQVREKACMGCGELFAFYWTKGESGRYKTPNYCNEVCKKQAFADVRNERRRRQKLAAG